MQSQPSRLPTSTAATFKRGYTYNTLRAELNHPGAEISHLPPPPPPGVDDRVPGGKLLKGDPSVGLPEFSIQGLCKLLVDFIISDDQTIYLMECPQFCQLILYLCHNLQDTDIPHCTKTCELIFQHWQECFMQLRVELKRAVGVISFTADVWSADKLDSYLAMTAHWIGHELGNALHSSQLTMKAALITFHYLPTLHMGKELAKTILHLIDCAKIPVDKIGHFTMDNTTNNNTAMVVFAWILQEEHEFDIDPVAHRICCFRTLSVCMGLHKPQHVPTQLQNTK
ncbi:hypothetical protein F5141DRAFT_1218057 [Pisolithus sp. B1]|nr:hypothetical protein F5141DRAFT_1218057 [Pisolithus sp. B1]